MFSRGELDTYRPTCHSHQARCATLPCQRVIMFASKWSKRSSCLYGAREQPPAWDFWAFHTAAHNPCRRVVFARLSCDQARPKLWGCVIVPVNRRCRVRGHGCFLFERRLGRIAKTLCRADTLHTPVHMAVPVDATSSLRNLAS